MASPVEIAELVSEISSTYVFNPCEEKGYQLTYCPSFVENYCDLAAEGMVIA